MRMEVPIVNSAIAPHVTLHCKVLLCCCQFVAVQHLANANSGAQCSCFSVMPHCECASNTVCERTVHFALVWFEEKNVTLHSKKMICVCFWNECAFLVIIEQVNEDDDCMVWPSKCAKEKQVSAIVL